MRAKVNENARVERIHVRRGTDLIADLDVNCVGTTIEATYDVGYQKMGDHNSSQVGLAMSIYVKFLTGTPSGRVEFQGAGAHLIS